MPARPLVVVKGAGDLATGVAYRLHRVGFAVVLTEIARPTPVRRTVSFAEAVYEGRWTVEGVEAVSAIDADEAARIVGAGERLEITASPAGDRPVAVLVDPEAALVAALRPVLVVDAILAKRNLGTSREDAPAVVALGPGFRAGVDCHAVIETMRGHSLGRVIYEGEALPNTGIPGEIGGVGADRVLRAPMAGTFRGSRAIGDRVDAGDAVATVTGDRGSAPVLTTIGGVLRGLLRDGVVVTPGFKAGDVDPRAAREHCFTISDKSLAIAGGVLEAAGVLLGGLFPLTSARGELC